MVWMEPNAGSLVVIGASTGGVTALLDTAAALPRFFPAPVCIVQHVGGQPSMLPELLNHRGPNHAAHAEDGERLTAGVLHVAPPGHHMLVQGSLLRLTRGAKENHARPAVDPLFRSAALAWGPRVIGVVLTGQLDDGTAGLKAIKDCGGIAIVQDPGTALGPGMPASALRNVDVNHCVALEEIPALLLRLAGTPTSGGRPARPERLQRQVTIDRGDYSASNPGAIADVSPLPCPGRGGSRWELREQPRLRDRCHAGHAFIALSLARAQVNAGEEALWARVQALREREMLLRRLANVAVATGDCAQAAAQHAQADALRRRVGEMLAFAESEESPQEPQA